MINLPCKFDNSEAAATTAADEAHKTLAKVCDMI